MVQVPGTQECEGNLNLVALKKMWLNLGLGNLDVTKPDVFLQKNNHQAFCL